MFDELKPSSKPDYPGAVKGTAVKRAHSSYSTYLFAVPLLGLTAAVVVLMTIVRDVLPDLPEEYLQPPPPPEIPLNSQHEADDEELEGGYTIQTPDGKRYRIVVYDGDTLKIEIHEPGVYQLR